MHVRNTKRALSVLIAALMLCSLCGCGSREDANQSAGEPEIFNVQSTDVQETGVQPADTQAAGAQSVAQTDPQDTQSGKDLDEEEPDTAVDDWYRKGNVYTDDNGRRLEVFFDDEGMLEFAVDGLSLYYTTVDNFQKENNWRIYTCDDGMTVIYYPGDPAHIEISDGDYAGLYEESGGK